MHLFCRNVNDGFRTLVSGMHNGKLVTEVSSSRNGNITRVIEPVMVTFSHPQERVLFNPHRDINPFSSLYESLWAIAGRNDVDSISYYTKQMKEYSDDGIIWHGAYGHRWRSHFGYDQIDNAVTQLTKTKDSRRVVLAMWDARVDGRGVGKDYPCNTQVYLAIRQESLNLTVCNRSNDLVWGFLGANYVVFSILLEYLATRVGVPIGLYHHMSNDLHAYEWNWKPDLWLQDEDPNKRTMWSPPILDYRELQPPGNPRKGYSGPPWQPYPLVQNPEVFEKEVGPFVEQFSGDKLEERSDWEEPFLRNVAYPMFMAYACHKSKDPELRKLEDEWCEHIVAEDWKIACKGWIARRKEKKNVETGTK